MGSDFSVSPSNGCQFKQNTLLKTAFIKATKHFNRFTLSRYHVFKLIFAFLTQALLMM